MKLNHLHIKAHNLDEIRRFYEEFFGFKKAFDHEGAAFLIDESGFLLAIFEYGPGDPVHRFPDWFHFGFCLSDETRVRELYTEMRAKNVEFARPLKEYDDGTVNFYCLDPAGHKVEVSWNPDEAQLFNQREPATSTTR
jgi:catechol 2,3-dioxygenase-like lactoylglutathione lyase family enzyme